MAKSIKMWIIHAFIFYFAAQCVLAYQGREADISQETVKDAIEDITELCFGTKILGSWEVYHTGNYDCTSIRKVLSIIPSCEQCTVPTYGSFSWKDCYTMQKMACSQTQYCSTYCTCDKQKGVTSVIPKTSVVSPETGSSSSLATGKPTISQQDYYGDAERHRPCPPCPAPVKGQPVSATMAAVLFAAGLVLGAMVTAVMCICVPCCNRKSISIRNKMTNTMKSNDPGTQSTNRTTEDSTPMNNRVSSGTYPAEYLSLSADNIDSQPYTQTSDPGPIYIEPTGDGTGAYQIANNGPIRKPHTVQSPVYHQFSESDIVSGNKPTAQRMTSDPYQQLDHTLNHDQQHKYGILSSMSSGNNGQHRPISDTNDTNGTANHNYFSLETDSNATNEISPSNRSSQDARHQYFVLEGDTSPVPGPSVMPENNYNDKKKQHEYFVLEKDS